MKSTLNSPFFDTNQLLACRLVCAVGCKGIALRALCKLMATKCTANNWICVTVPCVNG